MIAGKKFQLIQDRLRDPFLTALTIMLAAIMFVSAPLQAAGILAAHHFSRVL